MHTLWPYFFYNANIHLCHKSLYLCGSLYGDSLSEELGGSRVEVGSHSLRSRHCIHESVVISLLHERLCNSQVDVC